MNADETTIAVTLKLSDDCDVDAFFDRVDEAITIISECPGVVRYTARSTSGYTPPSWRKDK